MRNKFSLLALGLAAMMAVPVKAEDKTLPITVGVDVISSLDGLKAITHKSSGFGVTVGYNTFVYGTTVPLRVSGSYYVMSGATGLIDTDYDGTQMMDIGVKRQVPNNVKRSLADYQLAADVFIGTGVENLSLITGLSVQRWKQNLEGANFKFNDFIPGPKLGLRLGTEYAINKNFSANLMLQLAEFSSKQAIGSDKINGENATWLQVGVRYHF